MIVFPAKGSGKCCKDFTASTVDYILFLTADVSVTPNLNEIRDYKYVSKEELQKMFDDPCESLLVPFALLPLS